MAKNIKELLPSLLKQDDNWKFVLLDSWQSILGALSTKVTLEKIQDDTLILGVQDSCWLQELYLLSNVLIKTINQALDKPRIKNLRFKTTGIKKVKLAHAQPLKRSNKVVKLSTKENQTLTSIKDEQLRDVLKNFLIRCYNEK